MPKRTQHPNVSLFKRGGIWQAKWLKRRFVRDGKTVSEYAYESLGKFGIREKPQAVAWAKEKSKRIDLALRDASFRDGPHLDWLEQFDRYERHYALERGERGAKAAKAMRGKHLKFFEDFTRDRVVLTSDLTRQVLRDFRKHMAAGGYAPSSNNRRLGAAKAFLAWLADEEIITGDLVLMRKALKEFDEPKRLPRILTPDEIESLLEAAWNWPRSAPRRVLAMALMLLGGLRPIDVRQFNIGNVNLEAKHIRVLRSKGDRDRHVPFHDSPLLEELLTKLTDTPTCPALAVSGGIAAPFRDADIRKLVAYADILPAVPNDLRKTHVTAVACNGNYGEGDLSSRFGHTTGISIAHYRSARPYRREGETVEEWLGCQDALKKNIDKL